MRVRIAILAVACAGTAVVETRRAEA